MVDCIIQARLGSTRLPGKVMMKIDSKKTVLESMLNQLRYSKLVDRIIVATTNKLEDDSIENFCKEKRIECFRGNEKDVLDRYYQCAKKYSSSTIIRMPADKPLLDPNVVDKVIEEFMNKNYDYITTFLPSTFPSGTEVEIFSFLTLEKTWKESVLPSEREHVTPYIYNNPSQFKISNVPSKGMNSLRYTIDRENDLELVRKIVSLIKNRPILTGNIETLFKTNPSLFQINSEYERNEGYFKSTQNEK